MKKVTKRASGCLAALALFLGCSNADSGKHVAGRMRSLASAPGSGSDADVAAVASLRLVRRREQATGAERAELALAFDAPSAAAVLRLPSGEEVPLEPDPTGGRRAVLEVEPSQAAERLRAGSYTVLWRDPEGALHALTIVAEGSFPPYPTIEQPLELTQVAPAALDVTWSWAGTAGLFDLAVWPLGPEEEATRAFDLAGREHQLPGEALRELRRHRLEVAALSASSRAAARWESVSWILFDVGAP